MLSERPYGPLYALIGHLLLPHYIVGSKVSSTAPTWSAPSQRHLPCTDRL